MHIAIGERRRPQPFGQPGYLRVDSVHQGDLDGIKGLYHLNLVDEVTQFQFIGSVERIDTPCLAPVLEALLRAWLSTRALSLLRRGRDLVNSSMWRACSRAAILWLMNSEPLSVWNSVIRKHLGYGHIPSRYAERVNAFTQQNLSPYLNFHRPCLFPVDEVDAKGRVRKRYPHANVMTPYEKLKSLPNAAACLKPETSFDQLDAVAAAMSDNDAARALNLPSGSLLIGQGGGLTVAVDRARGRHAPSGSEGLAKWWGVLFMLPLPLQDLAAGPRSWCRRCSPSPPSEERALRTG